MATVPAGVATVPARVAATARAAPSTTKMISGNQTSSGGAAIPAGSDLTPRVSERGKLIAKARRRSGPVPPPAIRP